jgi:hypothetical protein
MLQMLFQEVTGNRLDLSIRRRLISYSVVSVTMIFTTGFLNMRDHYVPMWRMPAFYILLLQSGFCLFFREMSYHALRLSSDAFVERFKVETSRDVSILQFNDLWLLRIHVTVQAISYFLFPNCCYHQIPSLDSVLSHLPPVGARGSVVVKAQCYSIPNEVSF